MKKETLIFRAIKNQCRRIFSVLLFFTLLFTISIKSFAHRLEIFSFGCFTPGQNMTINALIEFAPANTWYQWQYRDNSNTWKCFINGTNTINGTNFTVSGATFQNVANTAPTLTINNISTVLENVLVRLIMRENASPCNAPANTTYGGDDLFLSETKYLRLHVFSSTSQCPPNSYLCDGNVLFNGSGYFGGFENKVYNVSSDSYTDNNFITGTGSSDFSAVPETSSWVNGFNSQAGIRGKYQVLNNPYFMNSSFARNIAPHSGNFQMVVQGSSSTTARAWYKSIAVGAGNTYQFTIFAARVDNTDPLITLKVNGATIQTYDLSLQPIGNWWRISGQYTATSSGNVIFSINDGRSGGLNNFALDDICFRVCTNCAFLPLHNLSLKALLNDDIVGLKWIAENEMNTSQFIIERSVDGLTYTEVGAMPVSGPRNTLTEYNSSDNIQGLQLVNLIYYRIRAIDYIDGRVAFSNIVTVRLKKEAGIQIWPSPFGDFVNISYDALTNTKIDIRIVNSIGKIVKQNNFSISHGINQLSVNNLEALASGIYFIRITDKNTMQSYIQKLIK